MRQTVTSIALALATTVLFWPTPLTAQPSSASSQLEAITVTSTRVNRDLSEIPLSISVVGQREIAENPKPDVSDHVKELPGVQLTTNTYGQHLFSLRGQSSDRTLILIDGVRQRIASSLLAEEAGGIYVDPSEIERIEVLKGPASSLYGSDAIGGVINVVTKKGGDKPLGFSVGLVYDGSTEGVAPKASVYGTRGGFYWRLSGAGFRGADLRMPDG
ncbi:MAG: TonB-dependent receptor plug domain-containing protein, partial [Deltaproteobacteria bacterium]|nr:TonB-dependent receptor plug domain-containing protein [Deltaproteobacteria bacterium]